MKLIPGKLYKPLQPTAGCYFHRKGEYRTYNNKVGGHSFLLYVGEQYDELKEVPEYFFVDTNGKIVALWESACFLEYFELIEKNEI